jgi:hypothetical protein
LPIDEQEMQPAIRGYRQRAAYSPPLLPMPRMSK